MSGRLRFCMLTTFYPPWSFGGDGIFVERLAGALADRGHAVTVVCSPAVHRALSRRRPGRQPGYPGVEVVALRDNLASLAGVYAAGRPLRARRQLQGVLDRGFDVLHFHNPSLLGAPDLFGMGEGVKLYTAHEQWLLCPTHVLWRRGGRVCETPRCWNCEIAHGRPPQPWRRTGLLERRLGELDALIAPSRTSARLHSRFAHLLRIETISHFAPEEPAVEAPPAADAPARPYFLYAGRLEPIKGVETLIDAFGRRRSEDLVIAGEGSLEQRLRRRAAGMPQVRFAGQLDAGRLRQLYAGALAVVMPTLGHEVFPLVAVEAFQSGTPLIARRFGALEELVEETGAGISYGSEEELDLALERIATDPELRRELGRRGTEAVADRYSLEAHMRRYLSLIEELRGRSGAGLLAEPV